jgi:hypothetical protein
MLTAYAAAGPEGELAVLLPPVARTLEELIGALTSGPHVSL